MKRIKYIIFDFDGTIADTIDLALDIYNRIAPDYNCKGLKKEEKGMLLSKEWQTLLKEYGISKFTLVLIVLRIRKEMEYHFPEINPIRGIIPSLEEIKKSGLRLGILTSNSKRNVSLFLDKNNLSEYFDFIYSGKSLFGKDKVMDHLFKLENISKEEVIYVGDEVRDIEASKKVGIPVISVTWGLSSFKLLSMKEPDKIANSPRELLFCINEILSN